MKSFIRKSLATVAAASSAMAPMASQFTAASAARMGTVAAVSSIATLAPSAAFAQSGKRMCGTVWDNSIRAGSSQGLAAIGMEVSKYDFFTCPAATATWIFLTGGLRVGIDRFAKSMFGNNSFVGTGLIGDLRMMETCEGFSQRVRANTGNVCLQMQDYRLYVMVKVGRTFGLGRI
jgi:hypothetical protein